MVRLSFVLATLVVASSAQAEEFQCQSSHPRVWGTLTISTQPQARMVQIEGDLQPGARLRFTDGASGPVETGSGTSNCFGRESVAQIVRFERHGFTVAWRNQRGQIAYVGRAVVSERGCQFRSLYTRS